MYTKHPFFVTMLALVKNFAILAGLAGQSITQHPRRTPEEQGVSSSGILDFLNAADTISARAMGKFVLLVRLSLHLENVLFNLLLSKEYLTPV